MAILTNEPDGKIRWWHLYELGCFASEDTEAERMYGGYGPFATFEDAYADWRATTICDYTPEGLAEMRARAARIESAGAIVE